MINRSFTASVMLLSVLAINAASAQTFNVTTHHYDNLRTGWNSTETTLTPGKVGGGSFQLQTQVALDAQVDTQPLLLTNQIINGVTHDVLYVTTENDSVYAMDAASGTILLTRSLGTPVPQSALPGGCGNNSNIIGIDGTPVIDTVAGSSTSSLTRTKTARRSIGYRAQRRHARRFGHAHGYLRLRDARQRPDV